MLLIYAHTHTDGHFHWGSDFHLLFILFCSLFSSSSSSSSYGWPIDSCNDGATQTIGFDRNATLDDWPKVYNTHLSLQRALALIEWEGYGSGPFRQHKQNERMSSLSAVSSVCAITHADTRTQNQSIIFYFRGWIFTHVNTLPAKPFYRIYFDAITHCHRTTHTNAYWHGLRHRRQLMRCDAMLWSFSNEAEFRLIIKAHDISAKYATILNFSHPSKIFHQIRLITFRKATWFHCRCERDGEESKASWHVLRLWKPNRPIFIYILSRLRCSL